MAFVFLCLYIVISNRLGKGKRRRKKVVDLYKSISSPARLMVVGGHVIVDISFSNSSSSSILYIVLFLPLLLLLAYTIITVYNIQYTLKYISRMASVRDSSVIIIIETAAPRQGGAGGGEEEVEEEEDVLQTE